MLIFKIPQGLAAFHLPSLDRSRSEITKEVKDVTVLSQGSVNGCEIVVYTVEPDQVKRSNGEFDENGFKISWEAGVHVPPQRW